MDTDIVEYNIPGARVTEMCVITPPIGGGPNGPVERWFEKSHLKNLTMDDDKSITIQAQRQHLKSRGIDTSGLKIIEPDSKHGTGKTMVSMLADRSARPSTSALYKQDYTGVSLASNAEAPALVPTAKKNKMGTIKRFLLGQNKKTGWVPSTETVTVAGREIGGMIYVGTPPSLNKHGYREKCKSYIDPSLAVASVGTNTDNAEMPYWPGYSEISPSCRANYLDWLASGRSDTSYDPGYMFLYFYGLERHFTQDHPPKEEKQAILDEVRRLAQLYSDNRSAQRYLVEFIQLAQIYMNDDALGIPLFDYHGWELPWSLKVAIGVQVGRGDLLSSDWVLSWLLCHPERRLHTAAKRCSEEFHALFKLRFDQKFPDGLKVSIPRKMLTINYQAASSEFQVDLDPTNNGEAIPEISGLRAPIQIAQDIANEVMDDLNKLTRFLGRNPDKRGSLEALALLPSELWPLFPSKELDQLKTWAGSIVEKGGLVPVSDVIAQLEGAHPETLSKRQLTGAADALARVGYGLAPDPRFALRSPRLGEPVMLFNLGQDVKQLEEVSPIYRAALIELALGTYVAHADGHLKDIERKSLLNRMIATDELSVQERNRLAANLEWMIAVPPNMALLQRKLKKTKPDALATIRAAVVSAAHSDGIIQPEEVVGIEKFYKILGLKPELVYIDLHAGGVHDGPFYVRAAQPGASGEVIPKETDGVADTVQLDVARIETIRADTEQVSAVLRKIFFEGEEDEFEGTAQPSTWNGLDTTHAMLVRQIITKEHWTQEAFAELCSGLGLMAAGALEAINEWSFETYEEALLDEYNGYNTATEIANAVKMEFKKESQHV